MLASAKKYSRRAEVPGGNRFVDQDKQLAELQWFVKNKTGT
jgi:hypothetical protein